jgi:predicted outer membrane repeat protein
VIGPSGVYFDSDTLDNNTAAVSGGAVYLQNVGATINNVEFDNNVAHGGPHR